MACIACMFCPTIPQKRLLNMHHDSILFSKRPLAESTPNIRPIKVVRKEKQTPAAACDPSLNTWNQLGQKHKVCWPTVFKILALPVWYLASIVPLVRPQCYVESVHPKAQKVNENKSGDITQESVLWGHAARPETSLALCQAMSSTVKQLWP